MALCRPGGLTGRYTSDSFFQNEELQRVDRRVVHILYPNSFGMRQSCFMSDKLSTGIALCVPIIKLRKCLCTGDSCFDWGGAGFQATHLDEERGRGRYPVLYVFKQRQASLQTSFFPSQHTAWPSICFWALYAAFLARLPSL